MTSNTDFQKVLLPMIRKVMPSLIANEIVGVQPMTQSAPRWETADDQYDAYPYSATFNESIWTLVKDTVVINAMRGWCEESLESGAWYLRTGTFYFRNAEDRTMFMLKVNQ